VRRNLLKFITWSAIFWVASTARATDPTIKILVLKEQGVGSPVQAQPFVDKFIDIAAGANQWSGGAKGQYLTDRQGAEMFIETEKPHYGIISLGAFLALRSKYKLDVVGQVDSSLIGGREDYVISSKATDLAGCKGKVLASNHIRDARFVEKVIARGTFKLTDFELLQTARPLQTIRKLLSGDATCALVDDAQYAELSHIEGGSELHSVWKSTELPTMPVVAFVHAAEAERTRFSKEMAGICDGEDRKVCEEVGIVALKAASNADYAEVIAAYGE
jgi:hypothetical protein